MGRGNYLPQDHQNADWRMVYVDRVGDTEDVEAAEAYAKEWYFETLEDEGYGDDPAFMESEWQLWRKSPRGEEFVWDEIGNMDEAHFENLMAAIREELPKSFWSVDKWNGNEKIVAMNNLFEFRMAFEDSYNVLMFRVSEDDYFTFHNLAKGQIDRVSRAFFNRLQKRGFSLSVRDGAWLGGQYAGVPNRPLWD